MNQRYRLSFLLDEEGNNGIDLISFDKLIDLDNYIKENFSSTYDVRKKFNQDIGEFCLENMEFIKKDNIENKRNWTGMIVITFPEYKENPVNKKKELVYIKLPMLYKNGKDLKSKKECLAILEEKLKNPEIVKKIQTKRWFLISEWENSYLKRAYHYINGYQHDNYEEKQLEDFCYIFCKHIKEASEDIAHYYLRCLGNICGLYEEKKTQVKVTGVNSNIKKKNKVRVVRRLTKEEKQELAKMEEEKVRFVEDAPDEFRYVFTKAIETGDYDTLYNMYSIDEIERYTIQGKRK